MKRVVGSVEIGRKCPHPVPVPMEGGPYDGARFCPSCACILRYDGTLVPVTLVTQDDGTVQLECRW